MTGAAATGQDSIGRLVRRLRKLKRSIAKRRGWYKRPFALWHMKRLTARRPVFVSIEAVTLCNARCVFCAYTKTKRDKQIMSMALFEKICRDYAALGGGTLSFNAVISDPLVDPFLFERARFAKQFFPNIKLAIFTNGIRFAKFTDDELTEILQSLGVLDISLGGLNEEDYAKMYGVPKFNDVWSSLGRIDRLMREQRLAIRRTLHFRTWSRERIVEDERYAELQAMGYDCHDVLCSYSDWDGLISKADLPDGATLSQQDNSHAAQPCGNPSLEFTITPNGDVLACGCMDGKSNHVVGNMTTQSISEIWTGSKFREFRNSFTPEKIHRMCKGCKLYWAHDDVFSNPGLAGFQPQQDYFKIVSGR